MQDVQVIELVHLRQSLLHFMHECAEFNVPMLQYPSWHMHPFIDIKLFCAMHAVHVVELRQLKQSSLHLWQASEVVRGPVE